MPRVKKFNSINKFRGNRFTRPSNGNSSVGPGSDGNSSEGLGLIPPPAKTKTSSSSKKLSSSTLPKDYTYDVNNVNIIVNVHAL